MNEKDFLHQYTQAAKESTDRTRKILLLMIVASILMFAAYWNSRSWGWTSSRLALAKATFDILDNEKQRMKNPSYPELKTPPGEEKLYDNAREYIKDWPSRTWYQAQESVFWSQKIRTEQVGQIQVPVLGISFDVNDLGMLGGFTLIVLLLWVNYSLWHQSNNFKLAFDFAESVGAKELDREGKNRILYHTYQDMAMHQVLTIPPRPGSDVPPGSKPDRFNVWIRKASKLLYALPLIVHTTVVANDWLTIKTGMRVNLKGTIIILTTGTIFWCLIAILTFLCFYMWRKTYSTWKTAADKI